MEHVKLSESLPSVNIYNPTEFITYGRRWLVLALYVFYCVVSSVQWLQYSIIADVISEYYGVTYLAVDWTSIIYMLAYTITIIPATWFFNKKGLRLPILLATGGTCLGAWIKVFSVAPDRFWVTFLGQTTVALSQCYSLSIAVPLAAIWFPQHQESLACSIGVFGVMLGNALGFLIPVVFVPSNSNNTDEIERGLSFMFYTIAILTTVLLLLQLIFLKSFPPSPPSAAQANRAGVAENETPKEFLIGLWGLVKQKDFVFIFIGYSINGGVFSAVTTFLNQMLLVHYPNAQDDAGYIGMTFIVAGLFGLILAGFLLDWTKKYKEIIVLVFLLSTLAMVGYTLLLSIGVTYVYVMSVLLGFFMIGYWPAAFELAAEITYPTAESMSACVLALGGQIFSVLYTMVYGLVFNSFGDIASNTFMSVSLILGTILTAFVKPNYLRLNTSPQHRQN